MEFIAAAVVILALFVPVFLALEVAAPHPGITRFPILASAEQAAEEYLAAHPLKPNVPVVPANDDVERIAA